MGQHVLLAPFSRIRQREVDLQKQRRIAEGQTKVVHVTLLIPSKAKLHRVGWFPSRSCCRAFYHQHQIYLFLICSVVSASETPCRKLVCAKCISDQVRASKAVSLHCPLCSSTHTVESTSYTSASEDHWITVTTL